jgi:SAM-dependent methyltransferase
MIAGTAFWDATADTQGHTGWADPLVYRYDQPLRRRAVGRAVDALFPEGLADRDVLDIGCGVGDFVELAASRGARRVVGIDLSARVVALARGRFQERPGVELVVGSVVDAAFPDAAFDLVTSVTVLQHLTEDEALDRTLTALRRALKAGGALLLLELAPPLDDTVRHAGFPVVERPVSRWRTALTRAGFHVEAEAVYPQLGITALRGEARLVDALRSARRRRAEPAAAADSPAPPVPSAGGPLRAAWTMVRRATLAASWPFDHGLSLETPARWRYYRLLIARAGLPQGAD